MSDLNDKRKRNLVYIAGFLYTLALHKYFVRNVLASGSGIQGYLETVLIVAAFACCLIATHKTHRRYAPSSALLSFAAFGVLALASSYRSFNLTLSLGEVVLFFLVLGIGYLTSQAELSASLFQSIYWTYTTSLAVGLAIGVAFPTHFPLWSTDDYDGRTRLSVFSTYPGTMGETAAYLVLLSPLVFERSPRISRLFLIAMNIVAGGKTSTAALACLLIVEYIYKTRAVRSWRVVLAISGIGTVFCIYLYGALFHDPNLGGFIAKNLEAIYGHDVAGEAADLDGRGALWKAAISLLAGATALGYGFDGARNILTQAVSWSGQSHNGFLELGLAGGMPALAIFFLGLISVFRACWRSIRSVHRKAILVLTYMMIIAMFGITFNHPSDFGFLILVYIFYHCSPAIC